MGRVKISLGSRGMTVKAEGQWRRIRRSGAPKYICSYLKLLYTFLGSCVIRIIFPGSNALSPCAWAEGHYIMRSGEPVKKSLNY